MQNPYMQNYSQFQPSYSQYGQNQNIFAPASNAINWVSGESGAKAWVVGRGETVLLMDSENQCFYIKSADASGMPLPIRAFDYTERVNASNKPALPENDNYIKREELDAIWGKIEALERALPKKASASKKEVVENE